ncbi:flagellar hook-length control protein FliK [Paenibacillus filicis]|uniref:Flagellar hook-length control protein FliK n=1 Tax=Paenibacillus filicis TaxID=669464 RepID=A0ABU9DNA7_9BACL
MEIQATSVTVTSTNGSSSGSGAASAGSGSFNAALTGVMSTDTSSGSSGKSSGNGLIALLQQLMPLFAQTGLSEEQLAGLQGGQLDGLIQLLEQADASGQGEAVLQQPELQSWLQDLQALLAALTAGHSTSEGDARTDEDTQLHSGPDEGEDASQLLNPLLFVPLATQTVAAEAEGDGSSPGQRAGEPVIHLREALDMVKQLKELAASGTKEPALQQAMKELPQVLLHAAAQLGVTNQAKTGQQQAVQTLIGSQAANADSAPASPVAVQVVPHAMQKLEALALKHQAFRIPIEPGVKDEAPLFELLPSDQAEADNQAPVTVSEWMKQTSASQQAARGAVLQMPASSFTDDMTKFVVGSFVLGRSAEGVTEARISLYPQHLGHVEVKLTMHNGQLIAQFMADSLTGKEMLEGQLSQLRTSLQAQGIQVDKLEVSQSQGFQSGLFQEGRQQQPQSSKQQQKSSGKEISLDDVKAEEEALASRLRLAATDGSIDFTA